MYHATTFACISQDTRICFQTDYLDFAKAFDSVAHNELLMKLHNLGVTGGLWKWFKSYLTGRQQCVCIGNGHSTLLPVVSGVPQSSILVCGVC